MPNLRILPTPKKTVPAPRLPNTPPPDMVAGFMQMWEPAIQRHSIYDLDNYRLHVSDLITKDSNRKFCARARVLGYVDKKGVVKRALPPGMSLIHVMGHGIQDHITERFIAHNPFGRYVWGDWTCHCHKLSHGKTGLCIRHSYKPERGQFKCSECAGDPIHYKEIDLYIRDKRITGHPDLLILWNGRLYIYECKTIERNSIDFTELKEPLGEHTLQNSFYYWMLRHMHREGEIAYPPDHMLRYLYIDRSTSKIMGGRVYKEFIKKVSPAERIEKQLAKADQVNDAVKTRKLPSRICDNPECGRAKACDQVVDCFSRKSVNF